MQLVRRPGVDVNFENPAESRAWLREHVRAEILLRGQPHPKIYLLGKGFVEMLELDQMGKKEPGAHLGMTFQHLRRRNNVQRCFLVLGLQGNGADGAPRYWALAFEEVDVADGRSWWSALLEYRTDEATGLGQPIGDWTEPVGESTNPRELPPFLLEVAAPPPGSRPALVDDASDTWMPDIKFAFGDLKPAVEPPTDAKQMVELTAALGVVKELLDGSVQGVVVVRIVGRAWEQWVLGDDMPASLLEMIRWIANHRLPAAEAVALAQIALRQEDDPPVPGLQVIAERDGMFVETWAPIAFPEGPKGKKVVPTVTWWNARPVPADQQWIGIPSKAQLFEGGAIS